VSIQKSKLDTARKALEAAQARRKSYEGGHGIPKGFTRQQAIVMQDDAIKSINITIAKLIQGASNG